MAKTMMKSIKTLTGDGLKHLSAVVGRLKLAERAGLRFGGLRDYYKVFGYERKLTYEHFLGKYSRQDIVSRIIDAPPGATWASPPTISNEAMNDEFIELNKRHQVWDKLRRADRLSRMGHYSLLLFGFRDSRLDAPLGTGTAADLDNLLFIRPVSMNSVQSIKLGTDSTSPTFGRPQTYDLKKLTDSMRSTITPTSSVVDVRNIIVDASKVVHIVENALEDDVFGIPIMERIFNLLDDLLKTVGGTAETFWITANRGMHVDIDKDMDLDEEDQKDLADELDEYLNNLRRSIRTKGVKVNSLGSDTPQPQQVFDVIISLLSGATGIPKRILLGSEAGQLASEQDRANWAERIEERNTVFAEPYILRPTIDIMQRGGVLSQGDYDIEWPSAFKLNPLETGQVAAQFGRAIGNIARQTKPQMQITSVQEARDIVGLTGELQASDLIEQESVNNPVTNPITDDNTTAIPVVNPPREPV